MPSGKMSLCKRSLTSFLAAACLLLPAQRAWAGIYIPSDPNPYPVANSFSQIRLNIGEYRSLLAFNPQDPKTTTAEKGSLQDQLLSRMATLETKLKDGSLKSVADQLELTGCWLRTSQPGKVIAYLKTQPPDPADPDSVFLLSHLAMAQAADPGLLPKAIATMEDFLEQWPETKASWKYPQWRWMRRAETVLLQLWKTRHRESLTSGKPMLPVRIDTILGLEGLETTARFQPGKLPRNVWDKVDPEAEPMVVQLLYWLPNDARLYWAYGELLSAKGEVGAAYQVLNELVSARQLSDVQTLFRHRAALSQAIAKLDEKSETKSAEGAAGDNNAPAAVGEFPMKLYLNAIGLGILIGAGTTILLILQWRFIMTRFAGR